MKKLSLAYLVTITCLTVVHAAAEKGFFGFEVAASVSGVLSPTVKKLTIQNVVPGSPSSGKVNVGDDIVEVEGQVVAGSKAAKLKPFMNKSPGETIHLKLKRSDGETYSVKLVATARPRP